MKGRRLKLAFLGLLAVLPGWRGIAGIALGALFLGWIVSVLGLLAVLPSPPIGDDWFHYRNIFRNALTIEVPFLSNSNSEPGTFVFAAVSRAVFWLALIWSLAAGILAIRWNRLASRTVVRVPGHLLVFGSGNTALNMLSANVSAGRPGAAILPERGLDVQRRLRAGRTAWLIADESEPYLNRSIQCPRATLIAADAKDTANVGFVESLAQVMRKAEVAKDVSVIARIADGHLRRQLSGRFLRRREFQNIRLVLFSDDNLRARQALRFHSAFQFCNARQPQTAHLAVVGSGYAAEVMLVQILKSMHFPHPMKVLVTLIDENASRARADFVSRFPKLAECVQIRFTEFDSSNADEWVYWLSTQRDEGHFLTGCYLAQGDRARELKTAFALEDAFNFVSEIMPPTVLVSSGAGYEPDPNKTVPYDSTMLCIVGDVTLVQHGDLSAQERLDRDAASIHAGYLKECLQAGERLGDRPTLYEWEDLPEVYKEENRDQAEHNLIKLKMLSISPTPTPQERNRDYDEGTVESLSITEHDRWLASRMARNWTFAETRCDHRREHPDMVPWESLPEPRKELDRVMVRQLIGKNSRNEEFAYCILNFEPAVDSHGFAIGLQGCARILREQFPGFRVVLVGDPFDSATLRAFRSFVDAGQAELMVILQQPLDKAFEEQATDLSRSELRRQIWSAISVVAGPIEIEIGQLSNMLPALRQVWMSFDVGGDGQVTCTQHVLRRGDTEVGS